MVGSLTATRILSLSKEESLKIGPNHNYALKISVEVMRKTVPLALVNNGSALSVCPLITLNCLGIKVSELTPTFVVVRAYDNTRREVMGSIKLTLGVRPIHPQTEFQVINIPTFFNVLLGYPWLHSIHGYLLLSTRN